jgi:hypothetical protein
MFTLSQGVIDVHDAASAEGDVDLSRAERAPVFSGVSASRSHGARFGKVGNLPE